MSEKTRRRIYGTVIALLAIGVGYNLITQEEVPLWLNLVASVLGISGASLATNNVGIKGVDNTV